jgi:hypothetical protein
VAVLGRIGAALGLWTWVRLRLAAVRLIPGFLFFNPADAAVLKLGKGRIELGSDDSFFAHEQGREEGLVQISSDGFVSSDVQTVTVLQQSQGDLQVLSSDLNVCTGQLNQSLGFTLLYG